MYTRLRGVWGGGGVIIVDWGYTNVLINQITQQGKEVEELTLAEFKPKAWL